MLFSDSLPFLRSRDIVFALEDAFFFFFLLLSNVLPVVLQVSWRFWLLHFLFAMRCLDL